ncbi:MAG: DUF3194 domain-containing protein [Halobacteriaceae archaeon]
MGDGGDTAEDPSDETVVRVAAEAAEELVFSRVDRDEIVDLDVTISFEDGVLEVDVYLHAPGVDADRIADDAALAARAAVDDLFAE